MAAGICIGILLPWYEYQFVSIPSQGQSPPLYPCRGRIRDELLFSQHHKLIFVSPESQPRIIDMLQNGVQIGNMLIVSMSHYQNVIKVTCCIGNTLDQVIHYPLEDSTSRIDTKR